MNVRRLFVIGIAFVAMSMLGSVQAGLDLSGEKPVYTADGTSPGATLVLKGKEMKFTVEKAGTGKGDTSEMQMIVGGCTFKVAYTPDGDGSVSFGGNPALLKSPVGGSATETGITYGDSIPGTCSSGSTSFTADGDKFTLDVKFDYPEKDYPPLKFTFTNAKKYAPKKDEEAMGAETIAGLIVGAVVSFIVAVVAAVGFTWCCCWCEGCCFNDPKKCSKWNKKKQQRMKAEKGGENQEKEKAKEGDAKGGNTAKPDDGAPITESTKQPAPGSVVQGQFNETNQSPNKGVAAANPAGANAGGQVQI